MRMISTDEACFVAGGKLEVTAFAGWQDSGGSFDASQDYCTWAPDSPFGYDYAEPCYNHDQNYSAGTEMTRYEADRQFLSDMREICAQDYNDALLCNLTADLYYVAARLGGGFYYQGQSETAWDSPTYYNP